MRRFFFFFLALTVGAGTLFAQSGNCGPSLTWKLASGVLTISGTGDMTSWTRSTDVPWYSHRATIKSVVLEEGVTRVGSLAFSGYTNMTSISLPSTLTLIDSYSLYGCSGLTSLTLPASIATIEESAFNGCTGLKSITCEAVNPPAYGEDCFENVNKSIPLYVPTESVAKYKADADWGQFTNIQPMKCPSSVPAPVARTAPTLRGSWTATASLPSAERETWRIIQDPPMSRGLRSSARLNR